eukprot:9365614-Pyramimonas_sp.AAC.1
MNAAIDGPAAEGKYVAEASRIGTSAASASGRGETSDLAEECIAPADDGWAGGFERTSAQRAN